MSFIYATETRKALVAILRAEQRYCSADELYNRLKGQLPRIALSTVYRGLDLLVELGTVSRRSLDGAKNEYLYCADAHHHHAVCRSCGRVDDIECRAMDGVRRELLEQRSFALDDHEITFYGRCARCQAVTSSP